ncbi:hypothetical protein J6X73_03155 [Candidatus Saccharibacteria bacterium]|jgi:hypothetical protein|nr:hypothetical protein [Candidatus Saccharibacteria bacterium]
MMPTQAQIVVIQDRCDAIHEELKVLQRNDSRARVYLGRYYETILNRFITPLNVRLVENNLSSTSFINNQNDFNKARTNFMIDYVEYQKGLEDLVATDCKENPEQFYEKLVDVRTKRATVADDTARLRKLAGRHLDLVKELKVSGL